MKRACITFTKSALILVVVFMATVQMSCSKGFLVIEPAPEISPHREIVQNGSDTLLFAFTIIPKLESQRFQGAFISVDVYEGEVIHFGEFILLGHESGEEFAHTGLDRDVTHNNLSFLSNEATIFENTLEYVLEVRADIWAEEGTVLCLSLEEGHFFTMGEESGAILSATMAGDGVISCVTFG